MHTVTGKLNKDARTFQAGESTGFSFGLGEKFYSRETKKSDWTNYNAVIFAKDPAQIEFYKNNLVEGAIVSVSGKTLQVKTYNERVSLDMNNCSLDFINNPGDAPRQQAPQQQQGFQPQQSQVQQPAQQGAFNRNQPQQTPQNSSYDDFDDEIPF